MFRLTGIILPGIINALFFAVVFAQNPSARTASISGRVTVDGKPAANGLVTVVEVNLKISGARIIESNGREAVDRLGHKATTNSDGSYLLTGLPAGQYRISALSPAYVPKDKAQEDEDEGAKQITLDDGEARENVDFALIRGGVITGRVTDDENRPQIRRTVRLSLLLDDGRKREIPRRNRQSLETDDRGVFRIYGLRAGRYIASAGGGSYILEGKKFDLTYHPNATNEEQAKVIEVKEGSEAAGIDIRLVSPAMTYEVLGRVTEAETGKAVPQIRVYCVAVAKPEDRYGNGVTNGLTDLQGNFHLAGLKPGKYRIDLNNWNPDHPFYGEGKYFEINSENASGIDLILNQGSTVSGVVALEGGKDKSIEAKLYQAEVFMVVRSDLGQREATNFSQISPDGSFHFIGLPPGKLRIFLPHRAFFVLRIERDSVVQTDGINVGPGENISGVKLIVAHGDGVIRGEVKVKGGTLPENCDLSVRAKQIGSTGVSKSVKADGKCRFLIEGLLPGEYSWEITYSLEPGTATTQPVVDQNVYVRSGAETSATITLNLNPQEQ
jgi:Carboxypeptidase regulatory-like domain